MSDIVLSEKFSVGALKYILSHWDSWNFRPDTDKSCMYNLVERYIAAADGEVVTVKYSKQPHGHGRLFAKRGVSMQYIAREIRNAIAHPFYVDLDFVNCHPSLLSQKCHRVGIPCPLLQHYCNHRADVLQTISGDYACSKLAVLSVLNGGHKAVVENYSSQWLGKFYNEIKTISADLLGPTGPSNAYMDIAKKDGNTRASALNIMLCDIENECLMSMKDYLHQHHFVVGVLMFDGAMVEKKVDIESGGITAEMLQDISHYIFDRTGYRILVKIKDMTCEMLDVPLAEYNSSFKPLRHVGGEDSAIHLVLQDLEGTILKCNNTLFVKEYGKWTSNKDDVESFVFQACMSSNIKFIDDGGNARKYSCIISKSTAIAKNIRHFAPKDNSFRDKIWESNIGVICFNNGVYDFLDKSFTPYEGKPDVIPLQELCVNRDFPSCRPSPDVLQDVMDKLLKSTLGTAGKVDTYLQMIARAMAGEYKDKNWAVMIGERNSGKGLLQTINQNAFGPYVNTIDSSQLMLNASATDVKAQSWVIDCEFSRQTYTNEVKIDAGNSRVKLDGGLIKKFQSGGDVIKARRNYENEREVRTASRLFMNLNEMPQISAVDVLEQAIVFEFPFKFVTPGQGGSIPWLPFYRESDPSMKVYCGRADVIDAFTWLVLDAHRSSPVQMSSDVQRETYRLRVDEGDELVLVNQYFSVTDSATDIVLLKDINAFARDFKMNKKTLQTRLEKMGAIPDTNCSVAGVRGGRGFKNLVFFTPDSEP
eukprot:gene26640-biopygen3065